MQPKDTTVVGNGEWLGQTGRAWAAEWRRTDRSFSMLTGRLLERSREFGFESVLDIGCGAGELSLAIARGRPNCRAIGVDISADLVAVANERAADVHNISFELADAAAWRPSEPFLPELLVSRHGVMFFDDPAAAFANLRDLAAPGAALIFSCFRAWDRNPFMTEVVRLLPDPPPPPPPTAPGPFAFSDSVRVTAVLDEAGWGSITFEPYDFAMIVGAGADPVEDTLEYFATIGGAARAMREIDEGARSAFLDRVRELARANLREGIVSLRASAWIVTARKQ